MRITGLDHIVITTADIDKCIAFYAGILGLRHELKNGKHAFYFGLQKINIHCSVVVRHGALGAMQSIYLRDADGNLIEIAVYEKNSK